MARTIPFPIADDAVFLFYDTETSGLPDWQKPSEDPAQPKIVQLAAILTDSRNKKLASLDVVLRWPGLEVAPDAAQANGLTTELIERYGVDPAAAMAMFFAMWERATFRVAHNESFDARMVRIAQKQAQADGYVPGSWWQEEWIGRWKDAPSYCTANGAKPLMKLPPTEKMKQTARFANSFKTPNLGEAYRWATGKLLTGAHGAMADTAACRVVFFHLAALAGQEAAPIAEPAAPAAPVTDARPKQTAAEPAATTVGTVQTGSLPNVDTEW